MSNARRPRPGDVDLQVEARATIDAYKQFLASPAFEHSVDLMVLVKIAGDDRADPRHRLRAAETLAKLRLQAMEGLGELVGAREQALDELGLRTGPQTLALTQVNQKIEIVRASDWRSAAPLAAGASADVAAPPAAEAGVEGSGVSDTEVSDGDGS